MCPKNVEEHNYRNKILCIKLESEVNYCAKRFVLHEPLSGTSYLKGFFNLL